MASVNIKKFKLNGKQELKADIRHCDKDKRLETQNHSNPHINHALTKTNLQTSGYEDVIARLESRLEELDGKAGCNKRSDRVIAIGLEFPVPKDLPADKHDEWYGKCLEILCRQYGKENVIGGYFHKDEVHEYIDAETGRKAMSREHGHVYIIPEYQGKLNCKQVTKKSNIIKMNNAIHNMTYEDYGVLFMDGSKRKGKSTDDLKGLSQQLEMQEKEKAMQEKLARMADFEETERQQSERRITEMREEEKALQDEINEKKQQLLTVKQQLKQENTALWVKDLADYRKRLDSSKNTVSKSIYDMLKSAKPVPVVEISQKLKISAERGHEFDYITENAQESAFSL